jgi:hypothetical protein
MPLTISSVALAGRSRKCRSWTRAHVRVREIAHREITRMSGETDKAQRRLEPRHRHPLRQVLGVVPRIEFFVERQWRLHRHQ